MSFHKRNVMMTMTYLLISVNIFTVYGIGSEEDEGGPSENVPETEETYKGYTTCWKKMQKMCDTKTPSAEIFVRMAITDWMDEDFLNLPHLYEYYHSFKEFLNPVEILYPGDYCISHGAIGPMPPPPTQDDDDDDEEDENRQNTDPRILKCIKDLYEFGENNMTALQYGFYETKVDLISFDAVISNPILLNVAMVLAQQRFFNVKYLRHVARHARLREGYQTPLQFCMEYDLRKKLEHLNASADD